MNHKVFTKKSTIFILNLKTSTLCTPVLGIRIRMFLGLPDPDPLIKGIDPDPSLFHKCVEHTEILPAKENFNTKFIKKTRFLRMKIMCLWASYKKKIEKKEFFPSLKSLKKEVVSGVRPRSKMSRNPNTDAILRLFKVCEIYGPLPRDSWHGRTASPRT
jgi:hypothetical protein